MKLKECYGWVDRHDFTKLKFSGIMQLEPENLSNGDISLQLSAWLYQIYKEKLPYRGRKDGKGYSDLLYYMIHRALSREPEFRKYLVRKGHISFDKQVWQQEGF